jgi:hypothetical protein
MSRSGPWVGPGRPGRTRRSPTTDDGPPPAGARYGCQRRDGSMASVIVPERVPDDRSWRQGRAHGDTASVFLVGILAALSIVSTRSHRPSNPVHHGLLHQPTRMTTSWSSGGGPYSPPVALSSIRPDSGSRDGRPGGWGRPALMQPDHHGQDLSVASLDRRAISRQRDVGRDRSCPRAPEQPSLAAHTPTKDRPWTRLWKHRPRPSWS